MKRIGAFKLGIILFVALFAVTMSVGCPFRLLTGLPCPGCGMTRAFIAAAHFDFADAFAYHPLFPAVILCVVILIVWVARYLRINHKTPFSMDSYDANVMMTSLFETTVAKVTLGVVCGLFMVLYLFRLALIFL